MPPLQKLPFGWSMRDGRLVAGYRFVDFQQAMGFLTEVGMQAEAMGHHPDFHVHWNEVRFEVWSHDVGTITERDHKLVAAIALVARRHRARRLGRTGASRSIQ